MYNPLKIAAYFIEKAIDEGIPMTNMKILKLVYIAHGWYLGLRGEPLLNEAVMAWKYGPVIESLYDEFKEFRASNITRIPQTNRKFKDDYQYEVFLDKIWDVYKRYDGTQLSTLTHKQGTPWDKTYRSHGDGMPIPNDWIKEYYEKRLNKNKEKVG